MNVAWGAFIVGAMAGCACLAVLFAVVKTGLHDEVKLTPPLYRRRKELG